MATKGKSSTKRKSSRAPKSKYFWVVDGTVIRGLKELAEAVDAMDYNIFEHHVNNGRNDFATWVEDVFELDNLSRDLRTTQDKNRTVITILKHLVK